MPVIGFNNILSTNSSYKWSLAFVVINRTLGRFTQWIVPWTNSP